MDRLNQLRPGGGSGPGSDAALDASVPLSETYMSANESSQYYSLSESFDITPIKDVSLASAASDAEPDHTDPDGLISNLSPITKKDVMLDSYKIGKQIEAANILSGGVDIFDNENSYDGDGLVIDDNVNMDDKLELDKESHLEESVSDTTLIGTPGPVELASKDTEVVLQIDGKNVNAIDIGNGLYLYRKTGQEELAAVQIISEDDQAPTFKFLKVRENAEGNLEVYEEFEIEVSKDVPIKETKPSTQNTPQVPVKDINKATSSSSSNKVAMKEDKIPTKDASISSTVKVDKDLKESESKTELNLNGKMMKFNESRKSPVVGSFTPMTYHSTPNKEGKPLTKIMVDQQLHPSRHSDNVKKTIEVHTDGQIKKVTEETCKHKFEAHSEASRDVVDCAKPIPDNKVLEPKEQIIDQNIENKITNNLPELASSTKNLANKSKQEAVIPSITLQTINEVGNTSDQTQKNPPSESNNMSKSDNKLEPTEAKRVSPMSIPAPEANNDISKMEKQEKQSIVEIETKEILETIKPLDAENQTNIKSETNCIVPVSKSHIDKLFTSDTTEPEAQREVLKEDTTKTDTCVAEINSIDTKVVMNIETPVTASNRTEKPETNLVTKDKDLSVTEISKINTKALETKEEQSKLQNTEKKDVNIKFKDVVEAVNPIEAAKITEQTEKRPESHSVVPENETNVSKRSENGNSAVPEPDKSMSVDNVKSTKPISVAKEMDPKTIQISDKTDPQTSKPNQVAVKEPTKAVQSDGININKAVEPITISETENKKVTIVQSPTVSAAVEPTVQKNKMETKVIPQVNRFLPVAKVIDPKIGSKSSMMIVHKPILPNDKTQPVSKQMEPVKVYSKIDKMNTSSKGEAKAMSYYQVNPITKGIELKTFSKTVMLNPAPKTNEVSQIAKSSAVTSQIPKSNAVIITSNKIIVPSKTELKKLASKELNVPTVSSNSDPKSIPIISINNNHNAVPFGKWTEANKQEFLNKFKEIKPPASSNTKQIKNSNDLNRIDVLKKIDSQRSNNASIKIQDKSNVKDTVFSTKIAPPNVVSRIPAKNELKILTKPVDICKIENVTDTVSSSNNATSDVVNPEPEERREVNVNDLIGKAIVDMLNRPVPLPMTKSPLDEPRQVENKDSLVNQTETSAVQLKQNIVQQKLNADVPKNVHPQKLTTDHAKNISIQKKTVQDNLNFDKQQHIDRINDKDNNKSLDEIEIKMNKLHGIPFVERPPHELPKVYKTYGKSSKESTQSKTSNKILPTTSKQNAVQDNIIVLESDDDVIEHEPITGEIDLSLKTASINPYVSSKECSDKPSKKDPVITENDFDKFVRRNSKSYENCLTSHHGGQQLSNVVQTVRDNNSGGHSRIEAVRLEHKTVLPHKNNSTQHRAKKISNTKFGAVPENVGNQNYQSKIHSAYQSALTAKLQMDRPISIIEDKPVKVVFMDANPEFVSNQLNVQGKELSPAKPEFVESTKVSSQPVVTESSEDKLDDTKVKAKHQRKQILNPVQSPELELIQPGDLGFDNSPKKKRKTEEKPEKSPKNLVHKKSYLLGRAVPDDKTNLHDVNLSLEIMNRAEIVPERVTSTVSAIDNLVKAAELLENQSVQSTSPNPDSQHGSPVKRGRGRPRKYPLPEGATDSKVASPSPQKKPRLIDAKPIKPALTVSDEEGSDEEQMVLENWTMGKINENIVCPICNKLFRSENVVFKHVKHCTGVSPTRSDLEKRSPRRRKHSRESDNKSFDSQSDDMELEEKPKEKKTLKHRKSPDIMNKSDLVDIIVIEDTPLKDHQSRESKIKTIDEKPKPVFELINTSEEFVKARMSEENEKTLKQIADEKRIREEQEKLIAIKKVEETAEGKPIKKKVIQTLQRPSDHVCEFCNKTFRQLTYLVNHKLLHKKEQQKKLEAKLTAKLPVYSCEVCKKQFRKLHHLVQHRIIHNPDVPARTRKPSSEQIEPKAKEQPVPKPSEDTSAGFRCEPCDKSFRKLHHLVEHRETHDGINRQKSTVPPLAPVDKPSPPPQCDVCKKSFRKLHHLIEHKEQHHAEQIETSSEKSDDKSVQSSLSTRDIIHECSLCYMVFPNEHSLNKHFVNCQQKKKRQSKSKTKTDDIDTVEESTVDSVDLDEGVLETIAEEVIEDEIKTEEQETKTIVPDKVAKPSEPVETIEKSSTSVEVQNMDVVNVTLPKEQEIILPKSETIKEDLPKHENAVAGKENNKKLNDKPDKEKLKGTPIKIKRKRLSRQKPVNSSSGVSESNIAESSDDDEVRYMLNPNLEETSERNLFMQVLSNKRNSLQIERPIHHSTMSRRTSLQHPPKIPRMKAKAVEPKVTPFETKSVPKPKTEPKELSTDSDDSDVKYSFPVTVETKPVTETLKEKQVIRKSLSEKRKSLGGIARRKALGQTLAKHIANPSPPVRIIKKRSLDVEHRCDCGQLFNSAALLSRHTSLAHTPPRIRKRRSPQPEPAKPTTTQPAKPAQLAKPTTAQPAKLTTTQSAKHALPAKTITTQAAKTTRKSSAKPEPESHQPRTTRKSSVKIETDKPIRTVKPEPSALKTRKSMANPDSLTPKTRKSIKLEADTKPLWKPKRKAHSGVPVPDKMRKL